MGDLEGGRKKWWCHVPCPGQPKRVLEADPSASALVQLGG